MGSDARVVDAARVSFSKEASNYTEEQNTKLLKYLASHGHWTPFSHPMVTMRETVPIFVARQRFKHMVGFTYNEVSRRYVDDKPEFFVPDGWRQKAENKKQGSTEEFIATNKQVDDLYHEHIVRCAILYEAMIANGVAPEQARIVLPQSMYTSYYVTGSLAAWARAYKQRIDSHAQKEIQDLAVQWDGVIAPLFPESWKVLTDK